MVCTQAPQGRKCFSLLLILSCSLHSGCVPGGHRSLAGCAWLSSYPTGHAVSAGAVTMCQGLRGKCVNSLYCRVFLALGKCAGKNWSMHLSHLNASYELAGGGQKGPFQLCFSKMQRNSAPCFEHSVEELADCLCALSPSMNIDSCTSPRTTLLLLPHGRETSYSPVDLSAVAQSGVSTQ